MKMMKAEPSTKVELARRLREAEEILDALRGNQVDAVVGTDDVAVVRMKKAEDERDQFEQELLKLNATLEERVEERTIIAEELADKLRKIALEMSHVEERERQRLSRVLHDGLQQLLISAKFSIRLVKNRLAAREEAMELIDQLDHVLDQSIQTSRSLSFELSPPILHDHGLCAALHWLAEMRRKQGLIVDIHVEGELPAISHDLKVFLYHAVGELLLNIVKHAEVETADVRLSSDGRELSIEVIDQGKGFDTDNMQLETSTGLGLIGIQERLDMMNGYMKIDSEPGRGSRCVLRVAVEGSDSPER